MGGQTSDLGCQSGCKVYRVNEHRVNERPHSYDSLQVKGPWGVQQSTVYIRSAHKLSTVYCTLPAERLP